MTPAASPQAIRTAARGVIGTGALTVADLVDRLRADGVELGPDAIDDVVDALADDPDFFGLTGDRWAVLPALLEGVTWVAEVPGDFAHADCVPALPSLTLLETLAYDVPLPLTAAAAAFDTDDADDADDAGDGSIPYALSDALDDDTPVLSGPPGWLGEVASGLGAFTYADEVLTVAPADRPAAHPEVVAALRGGFATLAIVDELAEGYVSEPTTIRFADLDELLAEALVTAHPAFLAGPVAPLEDLLTAAGLAHRDTDVIETTASWADLDRWRRRKRLASTFGLVGSEVDEADMLLVASAGLVSGGLRLEDFGADEPDSPGAEGAALVLALCLVRDRVARAFVGEHQTLGTPPAEIEEFARLLLPHLDAPIDTGVRFVLAWALDRQGAALGAEAELERAARDDVDLAPMLRMLAAYRADRGDAPGAMALLRRIDADAAEADGNVELLHDEVEPFARHRPPAAAPRNAPCPCGSGRKYKVCHLGTERHPLEDRAPWLYDKADRYLHDGRSRPLIGEIAQVIARESGGGPGALLELLDFALVHDIVLHEAGVFDDFLAERDALLPDDEALTAARWALVDRSVFELEAKTADRLHLRDLRSGERVEVVNVHESEHSAVGDLVLGRPLPVGDTWRALSGFIGVPPALRDWALDVLDGEADPFEVAALVGRCFAPPVVHNSEGHMIVFHELTYEVGDGAVAAAALAADPRLDDLGDGSFGWSRDTHGMTDAAIATFTIDDDEMLIEVNSDERMAQAVALVSEVLPDARLVDHDERTLAEAMASRARHRELDPSDAEVPSGMLDPDDPEVAAILREAVEAHERRWVDEPVPALHGLTPRQALDDPIERVALDRLLADMERRQAALGPGAMDPDRVRRLLGI